jgi:hypothetical protein
LIVNPPITNGLIEQAGLYCPAFFMKFHNKVCRKKLFVYIKICLTIVIHNNDNRLS